MFVAPIETVYNGYKFRSRLEAKWAVLFNAAGIKYVYEPEGYVLSDGTKYLPDFYLPEIHTWAEVKGVMTVNDMHKIEQFQKDLSARIVICNSDMSFQASDDWGNGVYTLADDSLFVKCENCNRYYFLGWGGCWQCPSCGHYDGDNGFSDATDCFKCFVKNARQARFEHGETPELLSTI